MVRAAPMVAALFLLPALTLAGVPPLSGFVPKLALVEAGFGQRQYVIVGVSLLVSLLTLLSMMKIWIGAFWARPTEPPTAAHAVGRAGGPVLMVGPTAVAVAVGLASPSPPDRCTTLCERAAADLLDPARIPAAVFGR